MFSSTHWWYWTGAYKPPTDLLPVLDCSIRATGQRLSCAGLCKPQAEVPLVLRSRQALDYCKGTYAATPSEAEALTATASAALAAMAWGLKALI
jgi:hypothetical protein